MEDRKIPSPAFQLRAYKAGLLPGIVLVVWAVVFSFFRSDMSPMVFWSVFVSVALLIVLVPSWLVGQRAKRDYLERQRPLRRDHSSPEERRNP